MSCIIRGVDMSNITQRYFFKILALLFFLGTVISSSAINYGGKKSYIIKLPYKQCLTPPIPSKAIEEGIIPVNTQKAKELFIEGAFFYDARKKLDYDKEHIQDAKLVMFDNSKAKYTIISLPKSLNSKLIFYCNGGNCSRSYEAALAVRKRGYKNVFWYINGFDDWQKKGYPVESK